LGDLGASLTSFLIFRTTIANRGEVTTV